jgi:hypothetical protein
VELLLDILGDKEVLTLLGGLGLTILARLGAAKWLVEAVTILAPIAVKAAEQARKDKGISKAQAKELAVEAIKKGLPLALKLQPGAAKLIDVAVEGGEQPREIRSQAAERCRQEGRIRELAPLPRYRVHLDYRGAHPTANDPDLVAAPQSAVTRPRPWTDYPIRATVGRFPLGTILLYAGFCKLDGRGDLAVSIG